MKTRLGFVSNSSTTSFCIYGKQIDTDSNFDDLYDICNELGLETHCGSGSERYVGRSYSEIGDNETGAQFKADVVKKVKKLLAKIDPDNNDSECCHIEDAYRDG